MNIFRQFDAVWSRVTGTAAPMVRNPLERSMEQTLRLWQGYRQTAEGTRGGAAEECSALAESARQSFRQMQVEYFLETGDTYDPGESEKFRGGLMTGLRRLYCMEEELRALLEQAPWESAAQWSAASGARSRRLREWIALLLQ
ncbi:MAG: hypothetical protein UEE32_05230 [Oscillospiraceae bacterium]|nr:hypothetical protein [Oscillospiraceae bacterium]